MRLRLKLCPMRPTRLPAEGTSRIRSRLTRSRRRRSSGLYASFRGSPAQAAVHIDPLDSRAMPELGGAVDFRILGPLEVVAEGGFLDIGAPKLRAVLAALLLEPNRVVSDDRLIESVWDETPPESAQKALQVYVSQLRKLLGGDRVQRIGLGYALRVDPGELDLDRFERLRDEGKLYEALALWRGPPLAEFEYERFARSVIERLEELRLACLEERLDRDLAEGRHAKVISELEQLAAEHPHVHLVGAA